MPSPFPGMDPYLEQQDVWHDFHERFLPAIAEILELHVGPNYIVKIDEQLYVHELPPGDRKLMGRADVFVTKPAVRPASSSGASVLEAPVTVKVPLVDVESLAFVEIRDRLGREVVTSIEVLSPTNKRSGPHREQYLAKRAQVLSSPAHLVEIDLLRAGPSMPLQDLPDCDYYALVSRVLDRPRCGLWPVRLREPLPVIPIPLRAPDRDVPLDLRHALDRVYDSAGYAKYIYLEEPSPRLPAEEAEWARAVIAAANRS